MKQATTILDAISEEKRKATEATFLKEWTPQQFRAIRGAICKHFANKDIKTVHGDYKPELRRFQTLDAIMGLAYTSGSSYAGYWVCNTQVKSERYPGFHHIGFALTSDNKPFAILWDKDENEILLPL